METYQPRERYKAQGGTSAGFNPVKVADVASAMETQLRGGERRDQAYYDSIGTNDRTNINNYQNAARQIDEVMADNLKALSSFSKTVKTELYEMEADKIRKKAADVAMQAWADPVFGDEQQAQFEQGEQATEQAQQQMNGAAASYEENGGSPVVGEQLRTRFTGNYQLIYERNRLGALTSAFPSFYQERLPQLDAIKDPIARKEAETALIREFLDKTGASGYNPGFLQKYFFKPVRQLTDRAQTAWQAEQNKQIEITRKDEAANGLFMSTQTGQAADLGKGIQTYIDTRISQGINPTVAKQEAFKWLLDNEKLLKSSTISDLKDMDATGHPACPKSGPCTFGKVFGRELSSLEGAVADNVTRQTELENKRLKAAQKEGQMLFEQGAAELAAEGGRYTDEQIREQKQIWRQKGLGEPPSFFDDYETKEEFNVSSAKEKLEEIWRKQGFLTENDMKDAPSALWQDTDVKKWLNDGSLRADEPKAVKDSIEDQVNGLTTEITGLTDASKHRGVKYNRAKGRIRQDLVSQYNENLASGKYRNEDGSLNYQQALQDAADKVMAGAKIPSISQNGKDYTLGSTAQQRATRGNAEYIERVQVARDGLNGNSSYIIENNISEPEELEQAQEAVRGQGNYPAIYEDLAAGQVNITPYDIAMAQLGLAGKLPDEQPSEEIVRLQTQGTQRLLNFKPNLNKTERAFTQNNNAPGTVDPMAAVYTTGNIGPTSTGQHLDVKRADGSYFEYKDLDGFVEVDDPELGRVPLSRVPETGDWNSHTVRGSHGRDYGTYDGTPVYLVNGARVVDTVPTVHGDRLQIELPNGKRFFFLHGTSRPVKVLPPTQQPPTQSSSTMGKVLTPQEIGTTLQDAGWPSHVIPTMIAVARAESGGDAGIDTVKSGLDPNRRNEYSVGLLQVNYGVHKDLVQSMGYTEQDLRDPLKNAKVALRIYQMQGLGAWGAYTNGSYRNHL